jgi:hypothetical protein
VALLTDDQRSRIWVEAMRRGIRWDIGKRDLLAEVIAIDDALDAGQERTNSPLSAERLADLRGLVAWERDAPARGAAALLAAIEADRQEVLRDKAENFRRKYMRPASLAILRGTDDKARLDEIIRVVAGADYRTRTGWEGV